jgi:hypothetical protein
MMRIEQLWQDMEAEGASAWLLRHARAEATHPLVVALDPNQASRTLLVSIPSYLLPPRHEWPECRGLEWLTVNLEDVSYWGVRLRDKACADVFSALAHDLDTRLALTQSVEQAAAELFARVKQWQRFLKAWREGMSLEARRGLWGELHFLNARLLPVLGAAAAVTSWKAGLAAHQDFQYSNMAVEVKTTSAKQPQSIRITSERQLDETGTGTIFLYVVVVDEREVDMALLGPGLSLPALISELRSQLSKEYATLALFNDLLFSRGWIDNHSSRYESHRLTIREELVFRVESSFPRLVEKNLPNGVGDVNYALSLAACKDFKVVLDDMLATLLEINSANSNTKN